MGSAWCRGSIGFRFRWVPLGSGDSIVPVGRAVPLVPLFRWIPLFRRVPLFLWVPLVPLLCWLRCSVGFSCSVGSVGFRCSLGFRCFIGFIGVRCSVGFPVSVGFLCFRWFRCSYKSISTRHDGNTAQHNTTKKEGVGGRGGSL